MKFLTFMASSSGRIVRGVAGAALIILGLTMKSTGGYVLALVGVLPLVTGIFDLCPPALLFRMPVSGKAICARR
jgi:hypothetical protein